MKTNPFKVGDKVVRMNIHHGNFAVGDVGEVVRLLSAGTRCVLRGDSFGFFHDPVNLRAAIAGQDYQLPAAQPEANSGHMQDGSSVQKHSAGPLYPCVLVWRQARLGGDKYDVGVISPRNPEPLWFSTFDRAVAAATIIKEDLK